MKSLYLITSLVVTFLITSCGNDDDTNNSSPVVKSKSELLTQRTWILSALTVDPAYDFNGTPVTNLYSQIANCEKDNITKFNANGTYTIEEGQPNVKIVTRQFLRLEPGVLIAMKLLLL